MIKVKVVIIDGVIQAPTDIPPDATSKVCNGKEWIIYQGDEPQETE